MTLEYTIYQSEKLEKLMMILIKFGSCSLLKNYMMTKILLRIVFFLLFNFLLFSILSLFSFSNNYCSQFYSLLLTSGAVHLKTNSDSNAGTWAQALNAGIQSIMR